MFEDDLRSTAMSKIKVGVQLHPQATTVGALRDAWIQADEMGVDSIFVWDHFYPLYGDPDAMHYECWSLLAAIASTTKTAQFGALVTPVSYRNPDLLADMARTVDQLSGGRLILGLGAGWFQRDYDEYGFEFGTPATRLKAFGEALPRIKARLAKLNPGPAGPLPILIGGSGEKVTLRLVARHAQMWNCIGKTPEEGKRLNGILDEWCSKEGTDPAAIERTIAVGADGDIEAWTAAGFNHIILMAGSPYDLTPLERFFAAR